jgi:hypothetical protein
MLDYTPELLARPLMADREREAAGLALAFAASGRPAGLRAAVARRLAGLALALHREAARSAVPAGPASAGSA